MDDDQPGEPDSPAAAGVVQRVVDSGERQVLHADLWADDSRLQAAANNQPALQSTESGDSVARLQQALVQQGLALPRSTTPVGMDGRWGPETTGAVRAFQDQAGVRPLGGSEAGRRTLTALDSRLPSAPRPQPEPVTPAPDPSSSGPALGIVADGPIVVEGGPDRGVADAPTARPAPTSGVSVVSRSVEPTRDQTVAGRATDRITGPPGGDRPATMSQPVEVTWHNSTHESIFAIVRALFVNDDARAAQVTRQLLADPTNIFVFAGKHVAQTEFESRAAMDGKFALLPEAAARLAVLCGTDRTGLDAAVRVDKVFGQTLDQIDRRNFDDPKKNTEAQRGRESGRNREKRQPVKGNRALLADERLARIYVDLMIAHTGVPNSAQAKAAGGLDAVELKDIIGTDSRKEFLTDLFTQGVVEHRAAIGEVGDSFPLMGTLFEQVTWGNPTANRNLLHIGNGKPENAVGLVYVPDVTLYYDSQGIPLPSFAGEGKRDPGFNANPKPSLGFNIAAIDDPVLRDFFRVLKQQGDEASLIFRGAAAYFSNMELINGRVFAKLPTKIKATIGETLLTLGLFLLVKALIIAAERSRIPELQFIGAGMDALLLGAQAMMDIDFVDTTTGRLAGAGFHLCRVTRSDDGSFTKQAEYHMNAGAEQIATVIAEVGTVLTLKLGESGARKFMQGIRSGERGQLKCTFCEITRVSERFHREVYDQQVKQARERGQTVREGQVLRPGDSRFPSIEIHPDGGVFGLHRDVQAFHRASGTSGRRSATRAVFESHHVFEDSSLREFGVPRDEAWAGSFEADDHSRFTSWMKEEGRSVGDVDELYDLHRRMYQDLGTPELLAQLDRAVSVARPHIEAAYASGAVPSAVFPDFPARRARALRFLSRF